jgi:hypothetical protein
MPAQIRLWKVEPEDRLEELERRKLDLEVRLEAWIERDISIVSTELLVIGREVETDFGGYIDLLCLDRNGDVAIVELKRDKTPREITAQALDYASWVEQLSHDAISQQANQYLSQARTTLDEAFKARFGVALPDVLNEDHSVIIVGSEIDPSSERIIRYLSRRHGVNINAVTFNFFRGQGGGAEYIARVFLVDPDEVQQGSQRGSKSKRQPNRTVEELLETAERAGVGQLYRYLAKALGDHLQRGTTRSSLAFSGRFENSTKVVLSLIPGESSESTGLRFHVYLYRLAKLLQLDAPAIEAHLPESREEWKYWSGADEDYSGAAGYFRTSEEIARFVALFGGRAGQGGGLTPNQGMHPAAQEAGGG